MYQQEVSNGRIDNAPETRTDTSERFLQALGLGDKAGMRMSMDGKVITVKEFIATYLSGACGELAEGLLYAVPEVKDDPEWEETLRDLKTHIEHWINERAVS